MSFFDLFRRRPTPPPPRPAPVHSVPTAPFRLGLNVHTLSPAHLDACRAAGVTQIRTTVYADLWAANSPRGDTYRADVSTGLIRAAGFDVLLCVHGGDPATWPSLIGALVASWAPALPRLAIQVGNEPDVNGMTASEYARVFAAVRRELGVIPLVTAATGGADAALLVRALLERFVVPSAVAVHAYGLPPSEALVERVAQIRAAITAPIWCTEFGVAEHARTTWGVSEAAWPERQRTEWAAVASRATGLVDRAYGFVLDAGDPEGYSVPATVTAWLGQHNGGRA